MELNLILLHLFQYQTVIFGVDVSSSVDIDNKDKDILVIGKVLTQGLDDTTLTSEAKCSINFLRSQIKLCLSRHYNGSNRFLFFKGYINSKQKILK